MNPIQIAQNYSKIDRFPLKPGCIWEIELYLIKKKLKKTYMTSISYTIMCITASNIQRGTFPKNNARAQLSPI